MLNWLLQRLFPQHDAVSRPDVYRRLSKAPLHRMCHWCGEGFVVSAEHPSSRLCDKCIRSNTD
jgi:hypothetical protein